MLQFTKQVDYAIQLIMALIQQEKKQLLSLRKFSKESDISFLFLQRIARRLRHAGIIDAVKGAYGGYFLKVKPDKIRLKDLVEAVEGEYALSDCLRGGCHCAKEKFCTSKKIFKAINHDISEYLNNHFLVDFLNYEKTTDKDK